MNFLPFVSRDETPSGGGADPGDAAGPEPLARTPADIFVDTGLTPEEFVLEELGARDGPIRQQEFCAYTGLSDSTISTLLSRMERAGRITRLRVGAEKIVFLPGARSAPLAQPRPDEDSP